MRYYIYMDGDTIVGYHQTDKVLQPPAIEVTKEKFIELGLYIEPIQMPDPDPDPNPGTSSEYDEFIAGLMEGYQNG